MAVIPEGALEQIQFAETHISAWTNPSAIGLTAAQVQNLTNLTKAARMSYNATQATRAAAKAATVGFHNDTAAMRTALAELVRVIKTYADTTNNPNVYTLAQIDPPAPPSPAEAPGKPEQFTITLNSGGSLTLRWKSSNAAASSGGMFSVTRKIGNGSYVNVGSVPGGAGGGRGSRFTEWTDVTLPAGTSFVSYIVTPNRGGKIGEASDAVNVQFGVGGGQATVTGGELRIAA
jgi:hypothetical protein